MATKMTGKGGIKASKAAAELNAGKKAWISKMRNQVSAGAPKTKKCPKCGHNRNIKFYGVRTFKEIDAKGEVKYRFGLQSYCVDCRALPTVKEAAKPAKAVKVVKPAKKATKSPARKAVGEKVRRLLQQGGGEDGEARGGDAPAGAAAAAVPGAGGAGPGDGGGAGGGPEAGAGAGGSGGGLVLAPAAVPPVVRRRITIMDAASPEETFEQAAERYRRAGQL